MLENISLAIELLNSGIFSLITVQTVTRLTHSESIFCWINNVYLEPKTIIVLLTKIMDYIGPMAKACVYLVLMPSMVASVNSVKNSTAVYKL